VEIKDEYKDANKSDCLKNFTFYWVRMICKILPKKRIKLNNLLKALKMQLKSKISEKQQIEVSDKDTNQERIFACYFISLLGKYLQWKIASINRII